MLRRLLLIHTVLSPEGLKNRVEYLGQRFKTTSQSPIPRWSLGVQPESISGRQALRHVARRFRLLRVPGQIG